MNARALALAAALALTASAVRAQLADVLRDRAQPGADKYAICPPSDSACQIDFMNKSAKNDPTQVMAAYDPPPGQKWASDTCRHVPCAIVPDPAQKEKPAIQGPPSMKPFDNGILKGNALYFPDGTVSYCFDNSCSTRLTPDQAKAYLDKKATDDANKKDFSDSGKDIKDDKSGDKGDTTSPGYTDGRDVASMFNIGGKGAPTDVNGKSVIFVDGNTEVRKHNVFTFTKTAHNAELLRQQQFNAKKSGAFAADQAPNPDAETPINPEPTRAAANND